MQHTNHNRLECQSFCELARSCAGKCRLRQPSGTQCNLGAAAHCRCKPAASVLDLPPLPVGMLEYLSRGSLPKAFRIQINNSHLDCGSQQGCFQTLALSPRRKKSDSHIILVVNNRSILAFVTCRLTKPVQMYYKKFSLPISLRASLLSQSRLFSVFQCG